MLNVAVRAGLKRWPHLGLSTSHSIFPFRTGGSLHAHARACVCVCVGVGGWVGGWVGACTQLTCMCTYYCMRLYVHACRDVASIARRIGFAFFGVPGTELTPDFIEQVRAAVPNGEYHRHSTLRKVLFDSAAEA